MGLLTIFSWGCLGLLGKEASSLPPFFVIAFCFWGAVLIGVILIKLRKHENNSMGKVSKMEVAIGGGLLFAYHYLYFSAFHYASAIEVSLINYLWPAFVILLGNLFFSLKSGIRGIVASGVGFLGISILFTENVHNLFQGKNLLGYGLALSGAVVWGVYSNLRRVGTSDALATVTVICAIVATCSTGFSLATEIAQIPTSRQFLVMVILTVGPTGGAFYLWDIALKHGNAAMLAVLGYAAPVISTSLLIVSGVAEPSLRVIAATALVALGGLITVKLKAKTSPN